jgi:hypothetical protein
MDYVDTKYPEPITVPEVFKHIERLNKENSPYYKKNPSQQSVINADVDLASVDRMMADMSREKFFDALEQNGFKDAAELRKDVGALGEINRSFYERGEKNKQLDNKSIWNRGFQNNPMHNALAGGILMKMLNMNPTVRAIAEAAIGTSTVIANARSKPSARIHRAFSDLEKTSIEKPQYSTQRTTPPVNPPAQPPASPNVPPVAPQTPPSGTPQPPATPSAPIAPETAQNAPVSPEVTEIANYLKKAAPVQESPKPPFLRAILNAQKNFTPEQLKAIEAENLAKSGGNLMKQTVDAGLPPLEQKPAPDSPVVPPDPVAKVEAPQTPPYSRPAIVEKTPPPKFVKPSERTAPVESPAVAGEANPSEVAASALPKELWNMTADEFKAYKDNERKSLIDEWNKAGSKGIPPTNLPAITDVIRRAEKVGALDKLRNAIDGNGKFDERELLVREAHARGENISPEVLAKYPDLQKPISANAETPQGVKPAEPQSVEKPTAKRGDKVMVEGKEFTISKVVTDESGTHYRTTEYKNDAGNTEHSSFDQDAIDAVTPKRRRVGGK